MLNAKRKSVLEHVVFDNLCAPSRKGWTLTGAVTFYESPVSISNCSFQNSRSEDSLNIVRSAFSIKHSQFVASRGDALDCDFTNGTLHRVAFLKSGNDAADFSGSYVHLRDCRSLTHHQPFLSFCSRHTRRRVHALRPALGILHPLSQRQ